ncbi:MAG: hypothetical protein U1E92_00675 [Moraxella osloensis]
MAGTYYARLNQEPEAVAAAIEEQYLPNLAVINYGDQHWNGAGISRPFGYAGRYFWH